MPDIPTKKYKCPKCRKENVEYFRELWSGSTIEFAVSNGMRESDGELSQTGDPYKVVAMCGCGHEWVLRKVIQIDGTNAGGD